jgi:lactoylglutathione lyase
MKPLFIVLLLSGSSIPTVPLFAQSTTAAPSSAKLNHIALYVSNLEKSTAFFERILKLKQIPEPFHDGKHTWFGLGAHGALHLIQGATQPRQHDKNEHLCFSVPALEEVIAQLDKDRIEYVNWAGNAKAPTVRVDGVKQIYFQDPDGHWIEVNNDYH